MSANLKNTPSSEQAHDVKWKSKDPDLVEIFENGLFSTLTVTAPTLRDAILFCKEGDAEALHHDLAKLRSTSAHADIVPACLTYVTSSTGQLTKIYAALHQAGYEIEKCTNMSYENKNTRAFGVHLSTLTQSNHTRLKALQLEPDPVALLTRPYWHDFYGQNTSRFPGDLSIWQRYLQPYFDRRKSPWTILSWIAVALIVGAFFGHLSIFVTDLLQN